MRFTQKSTALCISWHKSIFYLVMAICLFLCAPLVRGEQTIPREYQVKAAFLYNFANFVTWPEQVFDKTPSAFDICVLGEDPFRQELDRVVAGEKIQGRPIAVSRLDQVEQADFCQIIFISTSRRRHQALILEYLADHPILTIGETEDFISQGGMIQFFTLGTKIRFAISPGVIKDTDLKVSANLLRVAIVK